MKEVPESKVCAQIEVVKKNADVRISHVTEAIKRKIHVGFLFASPYTYPVGQNARKNEAFADLAQLNFKEEQSRIKKKARESGKPIIF